MSAKRVTVTGSGGFLGFHTRSLLLSSGREPAGVTLGASFDLAKAVESIDGADRLIHLAGVNRGTDLEIRDGNILFARQLAAVITTCQLPPRAIVFANSTQAGNGTTYGTAKEQAASILAAAAAEVGSEFFDCRLPNLFGEHGRPFYNAVTATFCQMLADGRTPEIHEDRELRMLHAQSAAELLVGDCDAESSHSLIETTSVSDLLERLTRISAVYSDGSIPSLETDFDRDLFNTYRSHLSPEKRVIQLDRRRDDRGSFFEVIRSHRSGGQTSFSTTHPTVTRGQHFHRRKIERFSVLAGTAKISMRKLFTNEVLSFTVNGDKPVAIDMPTLWTHNITNTGPDALYTMFWSNELFDPAAPDTFPEEV
ncbi:NAD-dependent epimerase/dehydratase family protein [Arthrobacter sp. NPDC057009]|uniref:polysaccharide biosynthesis C-terminal domain-containing protein n=1 Tax=Arthrobacter sp. NPDC057009 TaxID=3345996 RepID=UPI00362B232B